MFIRISTVVLFSALLINTALAKNYAVNVHGIVCEFCSFGVAKKVRKLPFIDSSKLEKGVKVDIENQMVFIAVRDDASLDKEALFEAIKSGGYDPIKIEETKELDERLEIE